PIGADESAVNAALVITLMLRVRHRYSRQFAGMLAPWLWKDRREETHLIHLHNTGVCSYTCICKKQANRENTYARIFANWAPIFANWLCCIPLQSVSVEAHGHLATMNQDFQ